MNITAMMEVLEVTKTAVNETVKLKAIYTDKSNNVDNNYAAVLPQATCTIRVDNADAFGAFVPGNKYRLVFTPCQ